MNSSRRVFDLLLQAATVELFHAYGLAVGPTESSLRHVDDIRGYNSVGVIPFWGPGFKGDMVLIISDRTLTDLKELVVAAGSRDRTRELTNQLMGRLKNRLLRFGLTLRVGLPTAMEAQFLDRRTAGGLDVFVHRFRTVHDDVFVLLRGRFDFTQLAFSNSIFMPREGDVILF